MGVLEDSVKWLEDCGLAKELIMGPEDFAAQTPVGANSYPLSQGGGSGITARKIVQIAHGSKWLTVLDNRGDVWECRVDGWHRIDGLPKD